MTLTVPHQRLRAALTDVGWRVDEDSGGNPSLLTIRKGRATRRALVYAWNVTFEGEGRNKNDWRVQTRRSHDGDLLSPPARLAMGLGWHEDYGLFAAFDVWVKRTTGVSTSIYFTRSLLDAASSEDWAEEVRGDGPECAFKPDQVEQYLSWLLRWRVGPRLVIADPVSFSIDGDDLSLRLDPWRDWHYPSLRVDDHVVLRRGSDLLDSSVWKVSTVETYRQITAEGANRNRPFLDLTCRRHGIVRDASWFSKPAD
jgi:hypothetical protein